MPQAENDPTIAMDTALAPRVVMPPCASRSAWKTRTMVPMTVMIHGPKIMAPRPTPVGCEQLPVTDGIFREESTKQKPPAPPRRSIVLRFSWTSLVRS